ncbi:MAG: carbamoyl-phosphate synthase large subunit [Planctomycetota bacterium]
MPRRDDLRTILILGSGPIVIGQGCEFDYSGAQACKALKNEGYRVVLVNSNPATIMTDPSLSDRTYIEPITPEAVRKVLIAEKDAGTPIDAVLPTLGGQTALNCACELFDQGVFDEFKVEMIGADRRVIHRAEDRQAFREICDTIGLASPESRTCESLDEALEFLETIGTPAIVRPAFTLGGWGGGIAYNREEFEELVTRGINASMIGQVQVDRSLIGWKEYELEVVRDKKDNSIIVCGIENIDAMGVHTGDSITVAPILTLTDKEYQALRDAALAIMREVGVETGGSNVQFAVNPNPARPEDGSEPAFEFVVVEMNPRVSRSSALASKATGFPIAKIAARLAVGYTLDELRNDITGTTSACFEPSIDYVVTKMPRWTFEKFPEADETLTTQMKSVGEAMSIGRTFKESLQKAIRSMEVKRFGLGIDRNDKWLAAMRAVEHDQLLLDVSPTSGPPTGLRTADGAPIEWPIEIDKLTRKLAVPSQGRLYYVRYALKMNWKPERIAKLTGIDPFFIDQIAQLVAFEDTLCQYRELGDVPKQVLFEAKRLGYSDAQLANLYLGEITSESILKVRSVREAHGVKPIFKLVDTCAAEFEAITPYYYSAYETGAKVIGEGGTATDVPAETELEPSGTPKVMILGGGPNRVGQGIEFDYCCVHAAFSATELGFESVMVNSNPETVSTDYDTSDLLFFEPLTLEDVLNIHDGLNARGERVHGVIVQFGGQTPLNLADGLALAGVPLIGTSLDSIDLAEDRDRFDALLERLDLKRPESGIARSLEQAVEIAGRIGYPVLVRPSYVLGGRGMEICPDEAALKHYMATAVDVSAIDDAPVLIDKFLDGATEVDVDVIADFQPGGGEDSVPDLLAKQTESDHEPRALVCGVMEHIEQAGVHSGDSGCTIPPYSLPTATVAEIKNTARRMARALRVNGLMNLQLAVKDGEIYVIEVNPRASRTVPFVAKAKHVPWPAFAAKVMMGRTLTELGAEEVPDTGAFAVKEPVFPFQKFPGVDFVLGPEMRSTGEVMGIDVSVPTAYLKALLGGGTVLPRDGGVFMSVRGTDKQSIVPVARSLLAMGYRVYATAGTAETLELHGMKPDVLQKIGAGARPNVLDLMSNGDIGLIINTPTRTGWQTDEGRIRATAVRLGIPMITTVTGAMAAVGAIESLRAGDWRVNPMQEWAKRAGGTAASPSDQAVTV